MSDNREIGKSAHVVPARPLEASAALLMSNMSSCVTCTITKVSSGTIASGTIAFERTVTRSDTGIDFQNRMLRSRRCRTPRRIKSVAAFARLMTNTSIETAASQKAIRCGAGSTAAPTIGISIARSPVAFERRVAAAIGEKAPDRRGLALLYDGSRWIAMARGEAVLSGLAGVSGWEPLGSSPASRLWTDDYTDVLATINW